MKQIEEKSMNTDHEQFHLRRVIGYVSTKSFDEGLLILTRVVGSY